MDFFVVIGITIVVIVAITNISDIIKTRYASRGEVDDDVLSQMQADLNDLKKSVDEMKEYITDLYIQQHDQDLK